MNFIRKNIAVIVIGLIIVGIGTCNYIANTSHKGDLLDNPQVGTYYVFQDFPEKNTEMILKIKEVRENELEFYVPQKTLIFGFKVNTSESKIRDLDAKGQMYGSETIILSKETVKQLIEANGFSSKVDGKPRIYWAFQ